MPPTSARARVHSATMTLVRLSLASLLITVLLSACGAGSADSPDTTDPMMEPADETTSDGLTTPDESEATANTEPPTAMAQEQADELTRQSQESAKAHEFGKAYGECSEALTLSPDHETATMVCAIAACNLKNSVNAERHILNLNNEDRQLMGYQICERNGVLLDSAPERDEDAL